jgi:TonB family protein
MKIFLRAAFAVLIACIATGFGDISPAVAQTTTTPSPTPDPCNHDAAIAHQVATEIPYTRSVGTASTEVEVSLDASGKITTATITTSSGDRTLDNAALKAATASTYQPKVVNCKGAPDSLIVRTDFKTVAQTATDAPLPTPDPCNHEAQMMNMVIPALPDSGLPLMPGTAYSAKVEVDLDASGKITKATITTSSGNSALDNASLKAATATTYRPKMVNCKGVPDSYIFRTDFYGSN